jgi:pimeloyl-ACP methyl ester carboxylesterase
MMSAHLHQIMLGVCSLALIATAARQSFAGDAASAMDASAIRYKTVNIDGVDIFYREAGSADAPAVLLLHGFPTSSFMFRNLIPKLAPHYHVIAPDYPGFGQSSCPDHEKFHYTFDHLANIVDQFTVALKLEKFALYVQDYGAPIGYRIASAHPDRITGIVVQNGNAYLQGLPDPYWKPIKAFWNDPSPEARDRIAGAALTLDGVRSQYLIGVKDPTLLSPDTWTLDWHNLSRPGNKEIQLDLLLNYQSNLLLYPKWQAYFRTSQPPMLIAWGKNDVCFPAAGAEAYKGDLKDIDFHLLDSGHFALEDSADEIAALMLNFLNKHTTR